MNLFIRMSTGKAPVFRIIATTRALLMKLTSKLLISPPLALHAFFVFTIASHFPDVACSNSLIVVPCCNPP